MSKTITGDDVKQGSSSVRGCDAYLWAFDDGNGKSYTPDVTKLTVQSFTEEHTPEFEATALDSDGNVGAVRRGPVKITMNIVGYAETGAALNTYLDCKDDKTWSLEIESHLLNGTTLQCNVTSWKVIRQNNEFAQLDLTAESYFRLRSGGQVCAPSCK